MLFLLSFAFLRLSKLGHSVYCSLWQTTPGWQQVKKKHASSMSVRVSEERISKKEIPNDKHITSSQAAHQSQNT